MISRFSLRLLTSFNRRLFTNQSTRTFCTRKIYRTLVSVNEAKLNLKPDYKYKKLSTFTQDVCKLVDDEPENEIHTEKPLHGLKHYLNYMKNNPDYVGLVYDFEIVKNETKDSQNELLLAFRNFIENLSQMNEEDVTSLKNKLEDERSWLKFYELVEIIHYCVYNQVLRSSFEQFVTDTLLVLDCDCYDRFNENTVDQNLFLAQVWQDYEHGKDFPERFLFKCKQKYCYKISNISNTQTTVLFYLFSRRKLFPAIEDKYPIWIALQNKIPLWSLDELALICRTIRQTKVYGLTSESIWFILNKLSNEINDYCSKEFSLIDILKAIDYCLTYHRQNPELEKFQQSLASSADKFSEVLLVAALKIGISRNTCNKELLNVTLNRVMNDVNNCRWRTIGSLLQVLEGFNISEAKFFDLIIKRLNENLDIENDSDIVWIVCNLIFFNVFPEEIISKILSPEFHDSLLRLKGPRYKKILKDLAFLDLSLELEKPDYAGPRLNEKLRKKGLASITYSAFHSKKFSFRKYVYTLEEAFQKVLGLDTAVTYKVLLPNFGLPCLVIKLDKNLKGQEIPESFRQKVTNGRTVKSPDNDHHWLAVRLLKIQAYGFDEELTATELCFNRQLRKLGYIPKTIKYSDWFCLKNDESLQLQYVENITKEALG